MRTLMLVGVLTLVAFSAEASMHYRNINPITCSGAKDTGWGWVAGVYMTPSKFECAISLPDDAIIRGVGIYGENYCNTSLAICEAPSIFHLSRRRYSDKNPEIMVNFTTKQTSASIGLQRYTNVAAGPYVTTPLSIAVDNENFTYTFTGWVTALNHPQHVLLLTTVEIIYERPGSL